MEILRFRVVLDSPEQVFRDIDVPVDHSFESLHLAVVEAFGMEAGEMSSFYESNDQWDKGREIPLVDMGTSEEPMDNMAELLFQDVDHGIGYRLLYVFDFLNLKIFYLEVLSVGEKESGVEYPRCVMRYGDDPVFEDDMDFEFVADKVGGDDDYDDYKDPLDDDYGADGFGGHENIDDYDGLY